MTWLEKNIGEINMVKIKFKAAVLCGSPTLARGRLPAESSLELLADFAGVIS